MSDSDVELLNVVGGDNQSPESANTSELKKSGVGRWVVLGVFLLLIAGFYGFGKFKADSQEASADPSVIEETKISFAGTTETSAISTDGVSGFGTDVGWDLFQSDASSSSRLNLETGVRTKYEDSYLFLATIGKRILVARNGSDGLGLLEFGPDGFEVELLDTENTYDEWFDARNIVVQQSKIWIAIRDSDGSNFTWELWDMTHDPVERVEQRVVPRGSSGHHPDIVTTASGGVFVVSGDQTAIRVADGAVNAVTSTHVLVQNCPDPFRCRQEWLHRDSFEVDELAIVPASNDRGFIAGSSPDGQYVVRFTYDVGAGDLTIWNVLTGESIDLFRTSNFRSVAFSPDSKFAAGRGHDNQLLVLNLETRESATFPNIGFSESVGFIPSSSG